MTEQPEPTPGMSAASTLHYCDLFAGTMRGDPDPRPDVAPGVAQDDPHGTFAQVRDGSAPVVALLSMARKGS